MAVSKPLGLGREADLCRRFALHKLCWKVVNLDPPAPVFYVDWLRGARAVFCACIWISRVQEKSTYVL